MKRPVEFYPKMQGRPASPEGIDLETGMPYSLTTVSYLQEENVALRQTLEKLLNEQIQQQEKILIVLRELKLHLAGISGEDVEPGEGED